VQHTWTNWARSLPVDGVGLRVVTSPEVVDGEGAHERRASLEALGYSVLDATHCCAPDERRGWLHRHVALVVELALTNVGRAWIRDLSLTSPRAHLVVVPDECTRDTVARERAPAWEEWTASGDVRRVRSRGHLARGRADVALAWLAAAVGAAARRSDPGLHADALWDYGRAALRWGVARDLSRVRAMCAEALPWMSQLGPRSRVVALAADVMCRLGDLESAAAWLCGVMVECQLSDLDVPPWISTQVADRAMWEGRWDAAANAVAQLPPTSEDAVGRLALLGWLREDSGTLTRLERNAPVKAPAAGAWATVASLVIAAHQNRASRVLALVESAERDRAVPWARAAAVDALRRVGCEAEASAVLDRWRRQEGLVPLEAALAAQLAGESAAVGAVIARTGAHGLRRWGRRRQHMSIWGGVSALLDTVNSAENDRSALRLGSRWVRTHTGTPHVVTLAASTGQVLTADPEGAVPGEDDVRVPIRQGGVTIGWVVAARRARDVDELHGCLRALAAACAPAVRACLDAALLAQSGDSLSGDLLGRSPVMAALRAAIARAAPTTFPVLIEGESGVGKELVAQALHRASPRRDRRLAAINCAALTDELFEAEVFGHTRGAFTGAVGPRAGLFEDAHQGTVFLDEVGELSPRAQAKLLRVLQEREVRRLGDNHARAVDVRVVSATNRPLAAAVAAGGYREDLLFRLAVVRLCVPPLRDRIEDVPLLAQTFWAAATKHRPTRAWLGPDALAALCRHRWPGNVRELQNVMAGLVLAAADRGRVTARHVAAVLAVQDATDSDALSLESARRALDRRLVTTALARHAGCRAAAARDLGVSRQGLGKLMARLDVRVPGVATDHDLR